MTDAAEPVLVHEMDERHKTTLLCFGGLASMMHIPPWEFFRVVADLPCNKIFVRDTQAVWYHHGFKPYTNNIYDSVKYLQKLPGIEGIPRLISCGNSAGGYAAILFGYLMDADRILAFVPQTCMSLPVRRAWGDTRWDNLNPQLANTPTPELLDLSTLPDKGIPLEIYHGDDRGDALHANYLATHWQVKITTLPDKGHGVIVPLRDSGQLKSILQRSIEG